MKLGWEIIPGQLWVRGIPTQRHLPLLIECDLVVSCLRVADYQLATRLAEHDCRYRSWPMSDGSKIYPGPWQEFAMHLAARIHQGEKVVIHCRAGRNRSALLAALVVREVYGCSGADARELVQERRPRALANDWFCMYLDSLPPLNGTAKVRQPQGGGYMSDETQVDLLHQMVEAGLVDEDDSDQPALSTSDPTATDAAEAQMEIQPVEADGRTWKGAEQLRPYLCRIEDLKPTEGNPPKGKAHIGRLKGSLIRFGQVRAILIDSEDGATIRAGHHLTLAAEELGWTHIAAIAAEFNDQGEAIAYLTADNRLARVGDEDIDAVKQLTILEMIGEQNLEGTGWDIDSVESLRTAVAPAVIVEEEPWGGAAAETAEEASARAKALEGYEPHKEIPLYMTLPQHEQFSEHVRLLQNAWGLKGIMDTILKALAECYEREAAPVGGEPPVEAASAEAEAASEQGGVVIPMNPESTETYEQVTGEPWETSSPDDDIPL